MSLLNVEDTIILIIDVQEKLLNAVFNKETLLQKAEIFSKATKILNLPVIVTEQYPKGLGSTVFEVKNNLPKNTIYFEKTGFNALLDENLSSELENKKYKNVIIFGIETHICVFQTIDALLEKGYNVCVVADCSGSRNEIEHMQALNLFSNKGVSIKTTEMILFEFLKSSKHPCFKEIQTLIK